MSGTGPVMRIYILGILDKESTVQNFCLFAEYGAQRGLCRVSIDKVAVDSIIEAINNLRSFVEGGFPPLRSSDLQKLGMRLFDLVIQEKARTLFLLATGDQQGANKHLPLEIIAEDYEVAGWPWEYLYNAQDGSFISEVFHPVSRSIFSMRKASVEPHHGSIKMLFILGVPPDDPNMRPVEEIAAIEAIFKALLTDGDFEIDVLPASDYKRLAGGIEGGRYDIVHFIGHAGFDETVQLGYLSIERKGTDSYRLYSDLFANLLRESGARLVFLNACKTAKGSGIEVTGQSSIAARLLDAGLPAIIGTQFSMPDMSAHFLAATLYNALLKSKSVGRALQAARTAMYFSGDAKFFDWGIPVLYATDPSLVLFPGREKKREVLGTHNVFISRNANAIPVNARADEPQDVPSSGQQPVSENGVSKAACATANKLIVRRMHIAVLDMDAKVGFLKGALDAVNDAQSYYGFELVYHPIPSGYLRTDIDSEPQTFVPRIASVLESFVASLNVSYLCALTQHLVAGEANGKEYRNYFASSIPPANKAFVISLYDLRRYAMIAKVPFTKAVVGLCISMVLAIDPRWGLEHHESTEGCLMDFCRNRDDIVVGLRNSRFDHEECRSKVKDNAQLEAIDRILAMPFSDFE